MKCPSCLMEVPENTKICPKCNFFIKREDNEVIELDHLNLIEDPVFANRKIKVEGIVSSSSVSYLVPSKIVYSIENENEIKEIKEDDPFILKLIGINDDVKYRRIIRYIGQKGVINFQEAEFKAIYKIRIRPPVFTLEKREEKIIDERGFEYKAYDIYIVSNKALVFNPSTLIKIEGKVIPLPKTQLSTILAYKVEFPEETKSFDINLINLLKKNFENMNVKERVEWILNQFEIYSKIIERKNLAFASLLCFFTPLYIKFNGELIKGWGNVLIIGDTTTAKTETIRKLIRLLKAGMLITAETASLVGLTGTATQFEKEGWFVDWGFLVLNDRKLLAIDGVHKLPLAQWSALAESERSGVVTIVKAAKNSAYARARQIKIANPISREEGRFSTVKLASFLYPAQALASIFDKVTIARLDLAVFSSSKDVPPEKINEIMNKDYDKKLEILSEVLKFCWNGGYEIEFEEEAMKAILKEATSLYYDFNSDTIPLASIDLKYKLARLSSALAILTLSISEDFKKVIVKKEHVDYIVNFIKEEYSKAGLGALAKEEAYELPSEEDVRALKEKIMNEIGLEEEKIENIIKYIVLNQRVTKEELKTKFSLTRDTELMPLLAIFSSEDLIKVGRGYYVTPKLIHFYKIIRGSYFDHTNRTNRTENSENLDIRQVKNSENSVRFGRFVSSEKDPPKILKEESEKNRKIIEEALKELQPNPDFKFSIEKKKEKEATPAAIADKQKQKEEIERLIFENKIKPDTIQGVKGYVCNICNSFFYGDKDILFHLKTHER